MLRQRREALGLDYDDVAAAVRIPLRHLESIETGRHRALPARTYAVGFVRAYAEYLGLDPHRTVARFKAEARELDARPTLVFPEPAAERRVPGGALVAVSVCAALAVYAVWYMQTAQHWARNEAVPPAPIAVAAGPEPVRETAVVDLAPGLGGTAEFTPPADHPPPAMPAGGVNPWRPLPVVDPAVALSSGSGDATVGPVRTAGPPVPRPRPDPHRPDSGGTATEVAAASRASPAVTVQPRGAQLAQAPYPQAPYPQAPYPQAPYLQSPLRAEIPSDSLAWNPVMRGAAPVQAAEVSSPGTAWAQTPPTASGPVLLKAVEASWIEVRSDSGEVVHARLMKAGETYEVPQREGLRLTTGNAGGLDVSVGGESAPKLGARGAVMREIPLEGQRLLSGTAIRN